MNISLIAFTLVGLTLTAGNADAQSGPAPLTGGNNAVAAQSPASMAPGSIAIQKFQEADTNHDGVLTLDEWEAAGHRQRGFNLIDANKDGKITPAELVAAARKYKR